MRAVIFDQYGPPEVLKLVDITKPKLKDNEILVKIVSVAVTAADSRIRGARFPKGLAPFARAAFGIFRPRQKILGSCFSGIVEAVGKNVTEFKPCDEVCGMNGVKMRAYAEYIAVKANKSVVIKPQSVSHDEAAGVLFGGTAALHFLRDKAKVAKGQKVVINGASGAVGTNAVQLAKYFGAEVTGVTSTENKQLVSSLGAKHIIDYKTGSLLKSTDKYDVILDAVGNIPIEEGRRLLSTNGKLVLIVANLPQMLRAGKHVVVGAATEKREDIAFLLSLIEKQALKVVIDKTYPLEDIVIAHQHTDSGRKTGNILLHM